jgi:hypothetical protein
MVLRSGLTAVTRSCGIKLWKREMRKEGSEF